MKNLLVAMCFAAGTIVSPATLLVATSTSAVECNPGVPDEYRRPGGYCDAIGTTQSLAPPVSSNTPGTPVKDPCAETGFLTLPLFEGERIHVAQSEECPS